MLSYEIDGSVLILRASGTTTLEQREPVFAEVRADVRVPNGAQLLLDMREVDVGMSKHVVVERLRILLDLLGPKLGADCAVIVTRELGDQARIFETEAARFGLRVNLFVDEQTARQWLLFFDRVSPSHAFVKSTIIAIARDVTDEVSL